MNSSAGILSFTIHSLVALSLIVITTNFYFPATTNAQEIDFGSYYDYAVTVAELNPAEELSFENILASGGSESIELANAKVITIEGVRYLDVFIDVSGDNALLKSGDLNCQGDPSCSLPFTLQAAFANRGQNNTSQATLMNVTNNFGTARFPILQRGNNRPAGPPPTPVHDGFNPAQFNETAYLYLFGSISYGNVESGSYTANITITVSYE